MVKDSGPNLVCLYRVLWKKKTSALKILKTHLEYLTDLVSQVGIVFRLVEIAYGNQYPRLEVFSTKESIIVSII